MKAKFSNFKQEELKNPKFIKPFSLKFEKDGIEKSWECTDVFDSVSILLYHTQFDKFILVKQFRPPVWHYLNKNGLIKNDLSNAYTYELCAGIMDKNKTPKQTAIEEVYEETGYLQDNLEFVNCGYSGLGHGVSKQDFFFAKIDESMKIGKGGGVDGEDIELFLLPKNRALDFIFNNEYIKSSGLMFMILWYFRHFK